MSKGAEKQPTVFILYIPGGAMLGMIPALTLQRIEHLTETPVKELFQVIEGVSAGAILTGGLNVPGISAERAAEFFAEYGPKFFPFIPGRATKMTTRQGLNTGKIAFGLDPVEDDRLAITNIRSLCRKMRHKNQTADLSSIFELELEATQRWLTSARQKKILKLGEQIAEQDPNLQKYTEAIAETLATRTFSSRLGAVFKSAATGGIDTFRDWFAPKEECHFDPKAAEASYKKLLGNMKISESSCSSYISAYDIMNNRIVTFSCLKDDLFNTERGAPAKVENDLKYWDAIMAATANELAYKAHITETNLLCADKAPFHRPRSVSDVLAKVPEGTKVVMVIAGTGKYLSDDLIEFMKHASEEDSELTEDERYRKQLEMIRDRRAELGVVGNLVLGQELQELEAYTMSDALDDFGEKLGKENIFEINPRLAPHNKEEEALFPSRDALDASEENIRKIIWRGRKLIKDEDEQIRKLSQMLIDNQFNMGRMDPQKYARACDRIGLKTYDVEGEIEEETKDIEKHIGSNDDSVGLRRVWHNISKRIFTDNNWSKLPRGRKNGPKDPEGPEGPS